MKGNILLTNYKNLSKEELKSLPVDKLAEIAHEALQNWDKLNQRLNQDSTNSSRAPSTDSPETKRKIILTEVIRMFNFFKKKAKHDATGKNLFTSEEDINKISKKANDKDERIKSLKANGDFVTQCVGELLELSDKVGTEENEEAVRAIGQKLFDDEGYLPRMRKAYDLYSQENGNTDILKGKWSLNSIWSGVGGGYGGWKA